jgi:pimeloyl-ACP methyl ester carboxylesterase
MDDEFRVDWERGAHGDEEGLTASFEDVLAWVDAGMPGEDLDDAERRMLEETVVEARQQGACGFVDDWIADAGDWGFDVEDIRVPTRIMGALEDTPFMRENSRWLAEHIPGAKLLWRAGGHFGRSDDPAEARLLAWLGHGVDPAST